MKYILIVGWYGDPERYVGPFDTEDEALSYAERIVPSGMPRGVEKLEAPQTPLHQALSR